jgi:hypothetical protein
MNIALPDKENLRRICKAISVLDAILCEEWEYRYYSYNCKWGEGEEFFEMRNGGGERLLILFREEGCVINGVHSEYEAEDKAIITKGLPNHFHEFIFGEPIATRGTNFCLWTDDRGVWRFNETRRETGMEELLSNFDGNPQTYIKWAKDYYEDTLIDGDAIIESARKIYDGKTLTRTDVSSLARELNDWERLIADLNEIDYPYNFV